MSSVFFKYLFVIILSSLIFIRSKAQDDSVKERINGLIQKTNEKKREKKHGDEFSSRIELVREYLNLPNYNFAKAQIDTLRTILDKSNSSNSYLLIAVEADYYKYIGNSELALKNYLKVYNYFSKGEDKNLHFKACVDLIEFYRKFTDFKRASNFIDSASKLLSQNLITDSTSIIRYFTRAASVKIEDKNPMASLKYSKDGLRLAKRFNNKNAIANLYNVLAFTYKNIKQTDSAVKYYKLAEDILFEIKANREALNTMFGRIELFSHTYESKEVKKQNIKEYENLLNKIKALNITDIDMSRIYLNLATDYGWLGDSVNYYRNLFLSAQFKISDLTNRNNIKVQEIMEKYDNERINTENISINEKLKLNAQILEEEERKNTLYIVLLSLAIIFILLVVAFYYQKQKLSKTLKHINSKLIEKNLVIEQKSEELRISLSERELLLKEIHHRVKNNLQIISGLLELQKEELTEEASKAALDEGQSRVRSISLIHQNLFQNESLGSIQFKTFTNDLLKQLQEVYGQIDNPVNVILDIPEIILDIDTAVPLGLIINELTTNSYKYAFIGLKRNELGIVLKDLGNGHFKLIYSDNGPGMKEGIDFDRVGSLGLRLIRGLASQLHGKASYSYNGLSVFEIEFKDANARQ